MQRRAFTLGAAALAVAGTLSLSMNVAMAKDIAMTADVVVIGAGTAGTAAALAAAETGAKVITLEKKATVGGTGNFSEGIMAVESSMQRDWNYNLTKDQAFKMIMDYGHWRGDARMVRAFLEKTASTIDWMKSYGVKFEKLYSNYPGGLYTWHIYEGRGAGWINLFQKKYAEMGQKLLLETPAKSLIQKDGKIVGVVAENDDGDKITIKAGAVIIATGGFGANPEMMKKYMRFPGVDGLAQAGKTGDGINMAWNAGAGKDGTEVQALYRPGPKGIGTTNHVAASAKQPHLWLDPQGRREVIETVERLNREEGMTVVLITHHMDEATHAGRVVAMNDGKIVADGTPEEVFSQVELLRSVGLSVPETTELLYALRADGFDLPLDALSIDQCAQALYDRIKA